MADSPSIIIYFPLNKSCNIDKAASTLMQLFFSQITGNRRITRMKINDEITVLKGIGEKTAKSFEKLGVSTVSELLRLYPRDYDRMEEISSISELSEGCRCVIRVTISSTMTEKRVRSLSILNCYASDPTGRLLLTFFNMPFLKKTLKRGLSVSFGARSTTVVLPP